MDSTRFLTGPELHELYLRDKSNDHLKQPENLKTLLTYVLNKDMRELSDSDLEIVNFCEEILRPEGFPDERKIQFLREKYAMIGKEKTKMRYYNKVKKMAACLVFMGLGAAGVLLLSGTESEAGVFDWVRNLFVEEDGEQLVISTPDATMKKVEIKEGHLPDRLPDEFFFEKSRTDISSECSIYHYFFKTSTDKTLLIGITESNDLVSLHQSRFEITKSSTKTAEQNGITYYYSQNDTNNCINWICDMRIYCITGPFSFSELEKIISYYN